MSHRLQVLIPESLDTRIRKAAVRNQVSKGEWVRQAIEKALEQEQRTSDPLSALESLQGPTADIDQMLDEIDAGRSR